MLTQNELTKDFEFTCDNDDCDFSQVIFSDGDIDAAIEESKVQGWQYTKNDDDFVHFCPTCVGKIESEKPEETEEISTAMIPVSGNDVEIIDAEVKEVIEHLESESKKKPIVTSKKVGRNVKCKQVFNWKLGTFSIVRTDTGEEIEAGEIPQSERQEFMFDEE